MGRFDMIKSYISGCLIGLLLAFGSAAAADQGDIFVTDTWLYRLYVTETPCVDTSRRSLSFKAEFRDHILARNPDLVARAAAVGAATLQRWPSKVTCINSDSFVGSVNSYFDGNLMFRTKAHITDEFRTVDTQFAERYGKFARGTPLSDVLRAFGDGEYDTNGKSEPDFAQFLADVESAEATDTQKSDKDYIIASVLDRENRGFPASQTPASRDVIDRLTSASQSGVAGATLHLLYRAAIRDLVYAIRERAKNGKTVISADEKAVFEEHQELINRALAQKVGLMMLLKSEMDRFGISIDPSVDSTYVVSYPSPEKQVVLFIKSELLHGKFCRNLQTNIALTLQGSEIMDYFKTANGCGMKAFTGTNVKYSFQDLRSDSCIGSLSCKFSARIRCVWQGLILAQACEGFEGAGLQVSGTVYFRNGKAVRYEID